MLSTTPPAQSLSALPEPTGPAGPGKVNDAQEVATTPAVDKKNKKKSKKRKEREKETGYVPPSPIREAVAAVPTKSEWESSPQGQAPQAPGPWHRSAHLGYAVLGVRHARRLV